MKRMKWPQVKVKDGIIYYTARDRQLELFTENKELLKILRSRRFRLTQYRINGRLCFRKMTNGIVHNWKAYDVALACYLGLIKAKSLIEDMHRFYDEVKNGRSIDHADDNVHNHTIYNLSFMDRILNSQKSIFATRLRQPPYHIDVAVIGGERYRIGYSFPMDADKMNEIFQRNKADIHTNVGCLCRIFFECNGAEQFVECLRSLPYMSVEETKPLRDTSGKWAAGGSGVKLDIVSSIAAQKELACIDGGGFIRFNQI